MFIHNDKFIEQLPTLNSEDSDLYGRVYTESVSKEQFPSITTVLSATKDMSGINQWKKKVGEDEASKILRRAGKHGTLVHQMVEDYLNNKEFRVGHRPNERKALDAFLQIKPLIKNNIDLVYAQEAPMCSFGLGVAGRADCIGKYKGVPSVIDFKTSLTLKKEEWILDYFLQATAYKVMWEEHTRLHIKQAVILIAVENSDQPQEFVVPTDKYITPLLSRIRKYRESLTVT
jgi:hypothetical protein